MSQAEVLRPKDAARFLGVSIQTLYRWTWTGKICRPFKIGDRASGWRLSDLQAFIDRREQVSRGAA